MSDSGEFEGWLPSEDLDEIDPAVARLIDLEADRQQRKLILIASESICPPPVREALASPFSNIYAEGYPAPRMSELDESALVDFEEAFVEFRRYADRRYYKGCDYVNVVESLAKRRAAEALANDRAGAGEIFVNVQPLSGAAANNAVFGALLAPGDRFMGMSLSTGGHLTHGSAVNRSGRSYDVVAYSVGRDGRLDYDAIGDEALRQLPQLIVAGFSAYPWDVDWSAFRGIADAAGARLVADIAHTAGLVIAGELQNPVGIADVVTFTTHKSLCGPRGACIVTTDPQLARQIDVAVFPGEQGGPHIQAIAGKAVAFGLARSSGFQRLMQRVRANAQALAAGLVDEGFRLAYGGTDSHMVLLDLKSVETANGAPMTGEIASRLLDMCGLTVNKNTIVGDESANHPSGLRFGTVWATQRGLGPDHMRRIAAVVGAVLRGAHAFVYHYAGGPVGRAKLEPAVLDAARAQVDALLEAAASPPRTDGPTARYPHDPGNAATAASRASALLEDHRRAGASIGERDGWQEVLHFGDVNTELDAARTGCALWDQPGAAVLEVSGRRAENLLQGASSSSVIGLDEGAGRQTMFLDADGAPLDVVTVIRTSPITDPGRFQVVTRRAQGRRIARWLRGLSDGYYRQARDVLVKVEGPAVVTVADGPAGPGDAAVWASLRLVGPTAPAVVAKAFPEGEPPAAGRSVLVERAQVRVTRLPRSPVTFLVATAVALEQDVWKRLVEAGATPAGAEAEAKLFAEQGLPVAGDAEPAGAELVKRSPAGMIEISQPFFVGQDAVLGSIEPASVPPRHDFSVPELPLRRTCLYDQHLERTQKRFMVPFAGWEMPVWYEGIGAEHRAVRTGAGLFDVSHMGVFGFYGRHAERFLDLVTTNYVPWLENGQCHYSYLLGPDGAVIDDIIVYREDRERFMVVVNAANAEVDEAWLRAVNAGGVLIDPDNPLKRVDARAEIVNLKTDGNDRGERRVDLAFQGPASRPTLLKLIDDARFARRVAQLRRFEMARGRVGGIDVIIARTGYTGEEIGYEMFPHPDAAPALWNLLLDTGEPLGVRPTGLGARDSTRLEAGLPLHGHELAGDYDINPFEAGYAPFVRMHKPWFVGRGACARALESWTRELVRFRVHKRGSKKIVPGSVVCDGKRGEVIGHVTSCVAIERVQVGLALVDRRHTRVGDPLTIFPASSTRSAAAATPQTAAVGDRLPLGQGAEILPRFARPADMYRMAQTGQY